MMQNLLLLHFIGKEPRHLEASTKSGSEPRGPPGGHTAGAEATSAF